MTSLLTALSEGRFVTRERARLWSVALLIGYAVTLIIMAATAHGVTDYHGRPLGTDFASFYAAGRLALAGHAAVAFDPLRLHALERAQFGAHTILYAFAYPPVFLLVLAPLAALPYLPALVVWQGATLALYLFALALLLRRVGGFDLWKNRTALLLALAFPAVFVNLIQGQNGFLTAGLFSLALAMLDERPWLAGLFFALLIYKPQFGLLIPLALLASGRWRTFAAAAGAAAVLIALTTALFGIGIWHDFLSAMTFANTIILDKGAVGYEKMQSTFAAVRLMGGGVTLAHAAQGAVTLVVAAALIWLWRGHASLSRKAAALCIAALLATPFSLDYDFMLLAPAIALLAAEAKTRGTQPYEASMLAALWLLPAVARMVAGTLAVPLSPPLLALGLLVVLLGARERRAGMALAPHP